MIARPSLTAAHADLRLASAGAGLQLADHSISRADDLAPRVQRSGYCFVVTSDGALERPVADAEDFIVFLSRFRRALESRSMPTEFGLKGQRMWASGTVPVFLHVWARMLDEHKRTSTDLLPPAPQSSPSWNELAEWMEGATTASPKPTPMGASMVRDASDVSSIEDLSAWLRHLADDCIEDAATSAKRAARGLYASEGEWAHGTDLDAYLEAWQACLTDSAGRGTFDASSWQGIAQLTELGKYYE